MILFHRNCSSYCELVVQTFSSAKEAKVINELNVSGENLQKYKQLTFIESSFTNLSENLVSKFENLIKLSASHCNIESISLPNLPDLQILMVNNNEITTINDTTFKNVENLTTINLSHNKLSTIADGAFTGLSSLKWLLLSFNNISVLNLGWFEDSKNLTELEIQHNKIQKLEQ
jgi:hypothetical protein